MSNVPATSVETPATRLLDLWMEHWERAKDERARLTAASGGDDGLDVLKAMVGVMLGKQPLTDRLKAAQDSIHHGLV